jgi:hypothetical protein
MKKRSAVRACGLPQYEKKSSMAFNRILGGRITHEVDC